MRIAHAASEVFPYLKTGGLADMVAALSGTLVQRGHEVAVFMPGYRSVLEGPHAASAALTHKLKIEMGDVYLAGDVYTLKPRPGLTLHLIAREEFFDQLRTGPASAITMTTTPASSFSRRQWPSCYA